VTCTDVREIAGEDSSAWALRSWVQVGAVRAAVARSFRAAGLAGDDDEQVDGTAIEPQPINGQVGRLTCAGDPR
jgi:hypothetical protein